jgi:hypothetical protein
MSASLHEIQKAWQNYEINLPEDQEFLKKMDEAEDVLSWLEEGANPFPDMPFGVVVVPPAPLALPVANVYWHRAWPHNLSDYISQPVSTSAEHTNNAWRVLVAGFGKLAIRISEFNDLTEDLPTDYPNFLGLNHIDYLSLSRQADQVFDETGLVVLHDHGSLPYARASFQPGRYRYGIESATGYRNNDSIRPAIVVH